MAKKAKPANQPSMPSMESIKAHITNETNKVRNLINMIEEVLQSEVDRATVNSLKSYIIIFDNKMKVLGELQSEALELIRKDKFLGAQNAVAANEKQIADHLVLHGVKELKSKLFFLQGQIRSVVKEFQAKGTTLQSTGTAIKQERSAQALELKETTQKQAENSYESELLSAGNSSSAIVSSISTEHAAEVVNIISRKLEAMEQTQLLLLEKNNLLAKELEQLKLQQVAKPTILQPLEQHAQNEDASWKQVDSGTGQKKIEQQQVPPVSFSMGHTKNVSSTEKSSPTLNSSEKSSLISISTEKLSPKSNSAEKLSPIFYSNLINSITTTIPEFDGNPEDYCLFMQTFNMLVHENDEIPTNLKQALLLKLLTGEARKMMRSTAISPEEYEALRDNLERQFNREHDNKQLYIGQLKRFSFSENNFDEMEKELNQYCIIVQSLRNKGCVVDDAIFIDGFIEKLPTIIMSAVFKKNREKERSFKELVHIAFDAIAEKRAMETARQTKMAKIQTNKVYTITQNEDEDTDDNDPQLFPSEEDGPSESQ